MPLYRVASTGEIVARPERYVRAFPEGAFIPVDGETREEERERLRLEALEDKVDIEDLLASPEDLGESVYEEGEEYAD